MNNLKEEENLVTKRHNILKREEEDLRQQSEMAASIKEECEEALLNAMPELHDAIYQLKQLTKIDLTELRSMRNPPAPVKLLMEGICVVLDVEPIKIKSMDGVGFIWDYWLAATGKHVLGNSKLVETLSNFDHDHLNPDIMTRLEEIISNEEFTLENVGRASVAARGLYMWIVAIKNYYAVFKLTEPKRNALFNAER